MQDFVRYTLLFIATLLIVGLFTETMKQLRGSAYSESQEVEEWCLKDILPLEGGSFGGDQGSDHFQVITTSKGHEIYEKCAKN